MAEEIENSWEPYIIKWPEQDGCTLCIPISGMEIRLNRDDLDALRKLLTAKWDAALPSFLHKLREPI